MNFNIFEKIFNFFESAFHKEYGIRALYMTLLLIPSISLYFLYRSERNNSILLLEKLTTEQEYYRDCLEKKSDLKREVREEVRGEVLSEFKDVFKAINNIQLDIIMENNKTIKEIKKIESKINK